MTRLSLGARHRWRRQSAQCTYFSHKMRLCTNSGAGSQPAAASQAAIFYLQGPDFGTSGSRGPDPEGPPGRGPDPLLMQTRTASSKSKLSGIGHPACLSRLRRALRLRRQECRRGTLGACATSKVRLQRQSRTHHKRASALGYCRGSWINGEAESSPVHSSASTIELAGFRGSYFTAMWPSDAKSPGKKSFSREISCEAVYSTPRTA